MVNGYDVIMNNLQMSALRNQPCLLISHEVSQINTRLINLLLNDKLLLNDNIKC